LLDYADAGSGVNYLGVLTDILLVAVLIVWFGVVAYILYVFLLKEALGGISGRGGIKGKVRSTFGPVEGAVITVGVLKQLGASEVMVEPVKLDNDNEAKAVTDSDGNFLVEGLPSGALWLLVEKEGYAPYRKLVEVKTGKIMVIPPITLKEEQ